MARRIWVITEKDMVEQSDRNDASLNGCPEIVNGIPSALTNIISEGQLPVMYEEPESLPITPRRNLEDEIDVLKTELAKLQLRAV